LPLTGDSQAQQDYLWMNDRMPYNY
jgi:hypothetical protein